MDKLELFSKDQIKKDIPDFNIGDTVRVSTKIQEENKTRLHVFEGVVISMRGSGISRSFCVRKISFQEGVEKIFPLHSPNIEKIDVLQKGKIKRAKLFYLRKKSGKAAKIKKG